ncbi:MAG: hypothetical protein K2M55_03290 [Muribaculaceae bacterium]|nr:hypothetical protein [Muribaculaceae bacterium]
MDTLKAFLRRPQVWGFALSVVVMAIIALAFFYPDNFEHNSLRQPDMQQGAANGHEGLVYEQATGEKALWTNALFGGMPTFQISPSYPSNDLFTWINTLYGLGLPAPSNILFMMMMGFFILLYALRMRWYYALIGAVAWGFSSYFIIIIGAGHIWKFLALTYVPPTIGGLLLLYRGHRITGTALTALMAMMQFNANHPQMTYYFGLLMVLIAVAYLIDAVRTRRMKQWLIASGLALVAGALAICANAPSLYNTYEYTKETKRAVSELTPDRADGPAERPTGGMPREQIVGWSYGRAETFSLIVPNIKGGASARPVGGKMVPMSLQDLEDAAAYTQSAPLMAYMSQYFNDSEGTNGPVYVGALIFALFLAGCFIVHGPLKWALVAGTIMSVVLALGRNAEGITDFMIYNFPMYSKFRAVESILVVAEFCIPLLAVIALDRLINAGTEAWKKYHTGIAVGFGVPVFVALLALVAPSAFGPAITDTDRSTAEALQQQLVDYGRSQGASNQQISDLLYQYSIVNPANVEAATNLRYGLVREDALRSLCILLLGMGILLLFGRGRLHKGIALAGIGAIILFDLYTVDKRYVSHESFGPAEPAGGITFTPDAIDNLILADTTTHYRVLDIPGFFSADRSYFHHTLGGYHAAKLGRYDDVLQRHLVPVSHVGYFPDDPALDQPEYEDLGRRLKAAYAMVDMLNARYVITGDSRQPVVLNDKAYGNAWLVDSLVFVDGADAEMAALDGSLDLRRVAVADRAFADVLPTSCPSTAPGDTIYLTSYTPNRLTYHVATANGGVGVFSEVFFPWGWHADIDGAPADIARVNYILRAMQLPAGSHTVTMTFAPASLGVTEKIAYACVTIIFLLVAAGIFVAAHRSKLF